MEKNKKDNILFSVITPCYNIEKYIKEMLDSVLNQTFGNFEIILINDGSIDNTGKILNEYIQKDRRIKVIHQENKGVSEARNRGIKEAKGKYIYFLDGDDHILNSYFEDMNDIISNNNPEVIICPYFIEKDKKKIIMKKNIKENEYDKNFILKNFFTRKICKNVLGTTIIKKDLLFHPNILFNKNLKYSEDYHFMIKVLLKASNFFYQDRAYYFYVQRDGSAINSKINLKRLDTLRALIDLENKLDFKDKILKKYFYLFYAISFIGNINVLSKQKDLKKETLKLYLKELNLYSKQLNNLKFIFEKEYFIYKILTMIYLCNSKICFFTLKILNKIKERIIKN